jgi:hypothetical protein
MSVYSPDNTQSLDQTYDNPHKSTAYQPSEAQPENKDPKKNLWHSLLDSVSKQKRSANAGNWGGDLNLQSSDLP